MIADVPWLTVCSSGTTACERLKDWYSSRTSRCDRIDVVLVAKLGRIERRARCDPSGWAKWKMHRELAISNTHSLTHDWIRHKEPHTRAIFVVQAQQPPDW